MTVYSLDPLLDPRWRDLLARHAKASVFHTPAWLQSLRNAYGYDCLALTTAAPGQPLCNGLVACRVKSWLTGPRIVSLPFADHCEPLADSAASLAALVGALRERFHPPDWKYIELRPVEALATEPSLATSFVSSAQFCFHRLDLRPSAEELFRACNKKGIQQCLRRAEREELVIEQGHSEQLLASFYQLLLLTRRRHQLPPQPLAWFQQLIRGFGDDCVIWIAFHHGQPIAAIVTLAWGKTVVYKYGCSDPAFHHLGSVPALIWRAIQYAKERNATCFDFGRSDLDNRGLIAFKDHWGASRSALHYYRNAGTSSVRATDLPGSGLARQLFSSLPDSCLEAAGRLLYRHMG
jgi:CelD/BcsL family acetyltransferase involved in cellulose biosynthesis